MNEPQDQDPLETELAAFRPPRLSPDFQSRVAGRLADVHVNPRPRRGRARTVALAAGLAAACLAAVWLGRGGNRGVGRVPVAVSPPPAPSGPPDDPPPTVRAYRQALARSSEDLEALLDRHAARVPGSARRPDRAVRPLSGEL